MTQTKINIAILDYKGALKSAVFGIADIISHADNMLKQSDGQGLHVEVIDNLGQTTHSFHAIILPPSQEFPLTETDSLILNWLRDQHKAGAILCSACVGLYWLAESGVLDGRSATTHWALQREFSSQYPMIELDVDQILIEHTDVITAGGMMAWMDLSLLLIERFGGREVAMATARHFVIDPNRRNQRRYHRFVPDLTHSDLQIRKAQHAMETDFAVNTPVTEMARNVALAPRTFLRRFKLATGMTPKDYIQNLRVEKARELLIHTSRPVNIVGADVGYSDQTAFARVFLKIAGETPSAFRAHYKRSG